MTKDDKATRPIVTGGGVRAPDPAGITTRPRRTGSEPRCAQLKIVKGPGMGAEHKLFIGTNAVGRKANFAVNDIMLDHGDDAISQTQHCAIECDPTRRSAVIYDVGGQNPVHVGGKLVVGHQPLRPGDLITVGATELQFDWIPTR